MVKLTVDEIEKLKTIWLNICKHVNFFEKDSELWEIRICAGLPWLDENFQTQIDRLIIDNTDFDNHRAMLSVAGKIYRT